MNLLKQNINIPLNFIYKIIVYLSITVFIIITSNIIVAKLNNDLETIIKLLVPLGILLSAALASISILKSMENTNRIEKEKEKRDLYDRRLKIYNHIMKIEKQFIQDEITDVNTIAFRKKVNSSEFIFNSVIYNSINNIYDELIDFSTLEKTMYRSKKSKDVEGRMENKKFIINKIINIRDLIKKELKLI